MSVTLFFLRSTNGEEESRRGRRILRVGYCFRDMGVKADLIKSKSFFGGTEEALQERIRNSLRCVLQNLFRYPY